MGCNWYSCLYSIHSTSSYRIHSRPLEHQNVKLISASPWIRHIYLELITRRKKKTTIFLLLHFLILFVRYEFIWICLYALISHKNEHSLRTIENEIKSDPFWWRNNKLPVLLNRIERQREILSRNDKICCECRFHCIINAGLIRALLFE